jgi:hypothetical protein
MTRSHPIVGKWNGPNDDFVVFDKDGSYIWGTAQRLQKGKYTLLDASHLELRLDGSDPKAPVIDPNRLKFDPDRLKLRYKITGNQLELDNADRPFRPPFVYERANEPR